MTQFTLAVDRPFSNNQNEREADFIPVVTWRQLAETCANYLRKGRLAAVEGRIQVRNYDNNEGRKVYVTEVIADNVRFLESANRGESGGSREEFQGGGGGGGNRGNNNYSGGNSYGSGGMGGSGGNRGGGSNSDPFSDDGKPIDISDDDLPF